MSIEEDTPFVYVEIHWACGCDTLRPKFHPKPSTARERVSSRRCPFCTEEEQSWEALERERREAAI